MKKIIYWILAFIILLIVVFIFNKNNFNDTVLSDQNKSKQIIFGEPIEADLNGDGVLDKAIWLMEESDGSGTFFYAQLLINKSGEFIPTDTMFLGDRITPQTLEVQEGRVFYNFAERKAGEPMTTPPSIGKSVWVHYDKSTNQIGEWVKGFEGEVDKPTYCKNRGGVWYPVSNVCEINSLSKEECLAQGGEFNECDSACRHDPKAQVCTLQCVLTCSFR